MKIGTALLLLSALCGCATSGSIPPESLVFPRRAAPPAGSEEVSRTGRLVGTLELRTNCIRLRTAADISYLPIWRHTMRLTSTPQPGVFDSATGKTFYIGEAVIAGGGGAEVSAESSFDDVAGALACGGPYVFVDSLARP